jgi:hypothetical protein
MSRDPPVATDSARQRRIAEIRRQIAAGTYETPEKLEAAVESLLASLAGADEGADLQQPGHTGSRGKRAK